MKRRARILSILLASVIAFTSVSVNSSYYAYADEENAEEESDSGDSGDSGDDSDDSDEHEEESHEEDTEEKEEENNEEENNEEQETDESEGESQESAQEDTSGETSVEESTESPEEETTSTEESTSTETASSEENGNSEENASTEENSTEEASTEGTEEATEAKAPEINFSGIEDKTYDGKAVEFSESNIEVSDDAEYSWGYYMDEEGTEKIDNAPVDAGEYYIVVKTKETEELKSASKSQKFVIEKAKATVSVSVDDAYDGEEWDALNYHISSVTGVDNDGELEWDYSDFAWEKSGSTINLNAWDKFKRWLSEDLGEIKGTLVYTPSEKYSKNYDLTNVNVKIKVYKNGGTMLDMSTPDKTYDAEPYNTVVVSVDGVEEEFTFDSLIEGGDSVEFYTKNGNRKLDGAPTDAGEYYVEIRMPSSSNRRLIGKFIKIENGIAGVSKRLFFSIKGAELSLNATALDSVYNGEEQTLVDANVTGVYERDGEATVSYEVRKSDASTVSSESIASAPVATDAGEYYVTVSVNAGANYNPVSETYLAKIAKAELTVSAVSFKGMYDGELHSAISDVTVKGVKGEDVPFTFAEDVKSYSEPGEYPYDIELVSESANYNNSSISGTAVIEKITIDYSKLTISANDIYYKSSEQPEVTVVYDGELLSPEVYTVDFGETPVSELTIGAHEFGVNIVSDYYVTDGAAVGSFNVVGIKARFFQKTSFSGGIRDLGFGCLTEEFYKKNKDKSNYIYDNEEIAKSVFTAPEGITDKYAEGNVEYYYLRYSAEDQTAYVYLLADYRPVNFFVRKSGVARPGYGINDASYNYVYVGTGKVSLSAKREGSSADDNISSYIIEKPSDEKLKNAILAAGYTSEEIGDLGLNFKWYRLISYGSGQSVNYHIDGNVVTSSGHDYSHHNSYTVRSMFTDGNGNVSVFEQTVYEGGSSKAVTFTPKSGYYISSLTIAGEEQDLSTVADGSYTVPAIENVTSNIDILANANPKVAVTITADSAEKVYDGEALTASHYTISANGVDCSNYIKVNVSGTITDAGVAENVVSYDTMGNDFMFSSINTVNGTLTVKKRDVAISVNNAYKTYGEVDPDFVSEGYSVTGLVKADDLGEIIVVRENNTESVGSYDDVLNVNYTENPNYNVIVYKGDFVINKASDLKITVEDESYKYDGTAHSLTVGGTASFKSGFTGDDGVTYRFYSDSAATKEIENSFTNAGVYNVWIKASDSNHNSTLAAAKVTVVPREITMTSGSAERKKNGKALTNSDITVTGDGFVNDEGASYDVTGSQTAVGSSDNTFDYTLKSNTLASNYSITKVYGILKVTKKSSSSSDSSSGSSSAGTSSGVTTVASAATGSDVLGEREAPEASNADESGVLGDRDNPNTGDSLNPVMWLTVLLASGACMISAVAALVRRKNEEE